MHREALRLTPPSELPLSGGEEIDKLDRLEKIVTSLEQFTDRGVSSEIIDKVADELFELV